MENLIFVISGPSGAGKDTVLKETLSLRESTMHYEPSYTTRKKRSEASSELDYVYVDEEEFLKLINEDKLLEYNYYDGNYYGTKKLDLDILKEKDIVLRKDVNGAIKIKEAYPEKVVTIYIMPKDKETLMNRQNGRGKDRMKIAEDEIKLAVFYDFLVINDDLDDAVFDVALIIDMMHKFSLKDGKNLKFLKDFYK